MLDCESNPPEDYFNLPENRLTTAACKFRRVMGLPDPPEFEGLSEEERAEKIKKADDAKLAGLTGRARKLEKKRRFNDYNERPIKGKFWTSLGIMPIGILADKDYTGPVEDQVDRYIQATFNLAKTLPEKLDEVLYAEELAEYNHLEEKHPELYELEKKIREDMAKAGMRPLLHKKRLIMSARGNFSGNIQELNKDGELMWTSIGAATRETNIQKLEEYKQFFEDNGFTPEEIERYVFRKQLRKRSDLEEIEEERKRLRLAQEGSLDAYETDTVVDIRDRADYLRKGLVGLDDIFNVDDFIITPEDIGVDVEAEKKAKKMKERVAKAKKTRRENKAKAAKEAKKKEKAAKEKEKEEKAKAAKENKTKTKAKKDSQEEIN